MEPFQVRVHGVGVDCLALSLMRLPSPSTQMSNRRIGAELDTVEIVHDPDKTVLNSSAARGRRDLR